MVPVRWVPRALPWAITARAFSAFLLRTTAFGIVGLLRLVRALREFPCLKGKTWGTRFVALCCCVAGVCTHADPSALLRDDKLWGRLRKRGPSARRVCWWLGTQGFALGCYSTRLQRVLLRTTEFGIVGLLRLVRALREFPCLKRETWGTRFVATCCCVADVGTHADPSASLRDDNFLGEGA